MAWAHAGWSAGGRPPAGSGRRASTARLTPSGSRPRSATISSPAPTSPRRLVVYWSVNGRVAGWPPKVVSRFRPPRATASRSTHIVPRWSTVHLSAVTHADVQRWISDLAREWSGASVIKVHRVFSLISVHRATRWRAPSAELPPQHLQSRRRPGRPCWVPPARAAAHRRVTGDRIRSRREDRPTDAGPQDSDHDPRPLRAPVPRSAGRDRGPTRSRSMCPTDDQGNRHTASELRFPSWRRGESNP